MKVTRYIALHRNVLAVAIANTDVGDWSAYIGQVEGRWHDAEWQEVAKSGDKLPQNVAELLFPEFKARFIWRE